jgi:beta-lactamase regulating signal transducer with metallopeptidase domain
MNTLILTLGITNILLIIGITGTVVGTTRLIYPSRGRYHR